MQCTPIIEPWFFSVTNKNLNWEIITKNLVIFKRWDCGVCEAGLIPQCTL